MTSPYLFIDGGYFRARRKELLEPLFRVDGDTDYSQIARQLGCRKGFYYDCADEQRTSENPADFERRKQAQIEEFNRIRQCPGFHVVQGTLSGRRQKEVDVALAVDMLMHAHAKNMSEAYLIAGDLDFRPLVKALIQLGIYLTIVCRNSSSSTELQYSADRVHELTFHHIYNWTTQDFQREHSIPDMNRGELNVIGWSESATGATESGKAATLFFDGGSRYVLKTADQEGRLDLLFNDRAFLECYFAHVWEPIRWG